MHDFNLKAKFSSEYLLVQTFLKCGCVNTQKSKLEQKPHCPKAQPGF